MNLLRRLNLKSLFTYLLAGMILAVTFLNVSGIISLRVVATNSMQGTIDQGSLVVSANWLKPQVGDIAIYRQLDPSGSAEQLVVHRVIAGSSENGYIFQGDNNQSADPETVAAGLVVGVVQFWIPGVALLFSWPVMLLLLSAVTFTIMLRKNVRDRGQKMFVKLNSLTGWPRKLWLTSLSCLGVVLIFSGLSLIGAFRLVHPQVGPTLPVGTATNSVVAIVPNSSFGPGDLAIAEINQKTALVRVESVNGSRAVITSTFGKLDISNSQIEGRIVLFFPFVGAIFEPFDK